LGPIFLAAPFSCAKRKHTYIAANVKCSTEPPTGFAMDGEPKARRPVLQED